MARSSFVYMLENKAGDIICACTVKHECVYAYDRCKEDVGRILVARDGNLNLQGASVLTEAELYHRVKSNVKAHRHRQIRPTAPRGVETPMQ